MSTPWQTFSAELSRWRDEGRSIDFWWRDDDASAMTVPLQRLIELANRSGVPLALAVVPAGAEALLLADAPPGVQVIQHGVDHLNRAAKSEKKTEFAAHESVDDGVRRLSAGKSRLEALYGERFSPVLAPPWNRIESRFHPALSASGFRGLSTYGPRARAFAAGVLRQINTHVDIIDWKGGRTFAGESEVLAQAVRHLVLRRTGAADPAEPTGWLTHHAVHDGPAWDFLSRLFEVCRNSTGVIWRSAPELFPAGCDK